MCDSESIRQETSNIIFELAFTNEDMKAIQQLFDDTNERIKALGENLKKLPKKGDVFNNFMTKRTSATRSKG